MSLMDFDLSQRKRAALARGADVYDLVEPVLQISRTGTVKHL
jgi:hypothetical protein